MSDISHTHGSNRRFSFHCSELDPATSLEVARFEGEESLAGLYRFELLLVSSNTDIDERMLIGAQATFRMNDGVAGGKDTCYTGIVENFEYMQQIAGRAYYKAALTPRLWRLGQFYLTEVYLDKTPLEIIDLVLQGAGLNHNEYDLRLANKDKFPKRKFIFQFQETYLDFLSRYCERLGIYWWFEYQQNKETLIFGNHTRSHDSRALQLIYQAAGELDAVTTDTRRVQRLNLKLQSLPQRITVMDHYYKRATQQIKGTAVVDPFGTGEVTYYGLHINTNEAAQSLAKIRAEGLICRSRVFSGESTATGLRCGGFIELSGHYRSSFNRQYLLTKVSHKGAQSGLLLDGLTVPAETARPEQDFYKASFSAIPADVQFRPEIIHPWPSIEGSLTAYIDAEGSGQYAELNEHGEYKVQLPYDITEKSDAKASAWIRMATPYAGDGYGMHFPLHKGTEVLLSFHNGNPDEPVILGAVYNSITANVVTNENQTESVIHTAGHNSIALRDLEGKQGIHLFSPTANTKVSFGAPPAVAQSVGANASGSWTDGNNSGTYTDNDGNLTITTTPPKTHTGPCGVSYVTEGSYSVEAENYLSNIHGSSTSNIAGAYTFTVEGLSTSAYVGAYSTWYGGLYSELYLGAKLSTQIGLVTNFGVSAVMNICSSFTINQTNELNHSLISLSDEEMKVLKTGVQVMENQVAEVKTAEMELKAINTDIKTIKTALKDTDLSLESGYVQLKTLKILQEEAEAKLESANVAVSSATKIFIPPA
ncbi:type VI secretion system tip protein VgrG [Candidatus Methylospira mobilis]|uniref:Type VI secretion system tip protein VgrG n=1 Tax=Candidatus Methylospira mobilis TaxID=1808979 RepID=A0A5Q0BMY2_9GAMM|nr:type VI secretion system tip protein TssI/VgrG [Candidatus Methylospira mobilis]QFY44502.1 type VI secretion system tip protein VgrG [Candidatus Methylospira mobilis]